MSLKERVLDLKYEMLLSRTERRQRAAKAALRRRGIEPRVKIGEAYLPPNVTRQFLHVKVA